MFSVFTQMMSGAASGVAPGQELGHQLREHLRLDLDLDRWIGFLERIDHSLQCDLAPGRLRRIEEMSTL